MKIDELEIGLKNINECLVLVPCLLGTDIAIKQFKNANMIQGRIAWFDGKSDCNIKIYGKSYLNKKEEFLEAIDLLIEFMKTPIEEREEPKKYYLRHRWLKNKCKEQYLNIDKIYDSYFLLGNANTELYKTQFTEKEIEELKEKFDTDLADFELVEVKDEN